MKHSTLWFRCVIACVMFCTLLSTRLFGCMRSLPSVKVPTNFHVSTWNDTKPAPGIAIAVYKDEVSVAGVKRRPVLTLQTGQDGSAEVKYLEPGVYVVATSGPGQGDATYAVVATNHPKPSSEIKLQWPYSEGRTLEAKMLTGVLASNNPLTPFENIHAELWTAGVQEPLAMQDIGSDGHFQFNETKPGLYILRIRGQRPNAKYDSTVEGDIPVELLSATKNKQEPLSLYLGMTDCGITYDSCPVPTADQWPTRRLQVLDPVGSVIKYAEYRVLNPAGAQLAAGSTGSNGIVELPHDLNGMVTLIVNKTGSPVYELPMDLIDPTDPAEYVFARMGVQGYGGSNCSAAHLEKNVSQK